ncbi:DUF2087 domain-containing protein [Paenibacillus alkalitolerans]|uniref:DUF2087 domain-containing protein n=1 Tax=Paenibacillus alkalitolerans TaxID=2799335 RepID=UPI0018F5C56D|nr:DUF2087 domain-containing protein [Paenibacillus alkalitolerans]
MDLDQRFWGASVEELQQGYVSLPDDGGFVCLVCGHHAENGRIYPVQDRWYEAEAYMRRHIEELHRSMFHYLLDMDKKWTGLTDVQRDVLQAYYEGKSDAETAKLLGSKQSTVRYHRFHLREKEKQAKVFLSLMGLLAERSEKDSESFMTIHRTAAMVDERYAVTNEEREKILKTYFPYGLQGPMREFPSKEKRKIVVLMHIAGRFDRNRKYTEKEVNDVLKEAHSDYVTLRRYMIDYGFLDRKDDCSVYWVKGEKQSDE